MTDVIFNGSINRSAHGRASVELVFDNPHNRVPGEFGRFTGSRCAAKCCATAPITTRSTARSAAART